MSRFADLASASFSQNDVEGSANNSSRLGTDLFIFIKPIVGQIIWCVNTFSKIIVDRDFILSDNARMVHEKKLAIRLPGRIKRNLRREARRRYISDSDVAREAIIYFLDTPQNDRKSKLQAA